MHGYLQTHQRVKTARLLQRDMFFLQPINVIVAQATSVFTDHYPDVCVYTTCNFHTACAFLTLRLYLKSYS